MATPASVHLPPDVDSGLSVECVRVGDREAEAQLLQRYACAVRNMVRRHCRPGEPQVDDLTQEILTVLLARLRAGAIEDLQALPRYLRVTIVHACADYYRQRERCQQHVTGGESAAIDEDPLRGAERQQELVAVRSVIAELPMQRDRQLLRRVYFEDQDRARVCAELDIDSGHFHRVIHRARERLREALERSGFTPVR